MLFHFEFYWVPPDGQLNGGEKVTIGIDSLAVAIDRAEDMLEDETFRFGKANFCLIKGQDGELVCEVWAPAPPVPGLAFVYDEDGFRSTLEYAKLTEDEQSRRLPLLKYRTTD